MKELRAQTLRDAIGQLPKYEPPAGIWENLEATLDADLELTDSSRRLASQVPPAVISQNLADRLPVKKPVASRIKIWQQYAAAAVLAGLLFGAWWLITTSAGTESGQISFSQERLDPQVVATIQEHDDPAFTWVDELCASRAPVCEEPEFKSLKSELDELTHAKQQLHAALGKYGDDPALTNQIVQIEV